MSHKAEHFVLAGLVRHQGAAARLREYLSIAHFESVCHGVIYSAALEVDADGQDVDVISVAQRLRDNGKLAAAGGTRYLSQLTFAVPPSVLATESWAMVLISEDAEAELKKRSAK